MKLRYLFAGVGLLAVLAIGVMSQDRTAGSALQAELGSELYHDLGLNKLSADEATRLHDLWQRGPADSYLEITARTSMEKAGWRPILVLGAVSRQDTRKEWALFVREGYEVTRMEPFGSHDYLPMPGWHWAKNTLSSWKIMLPDGREASFSARQ